MVLLSENQNRFIEDIFNLICKVIPFLFYFTTLICSIINCVYCLCLICLFSRTVRNNFRVCLIAGDGSKNFQRRCREYPTFTKNVNFIWFPHWSKTQLVEHAQYHLNRKSFVTRYDVEMSGGQGPSICPNVAIYYITSIGKDLLGKVSDIAQICTSFVNFN